MENEEEQKKSETSSSASEENKSQEAKDDEKSEATETVDYKAELEKEKAEKGELAKRIEKAENRIVKLKNKLDEAGIPDEPEAPLSKAEIQETIKEAIKPIIDELAKAKVEAEEAKRALAGKQTDSKGSGAGQKLPTPEPTPTFSETDKEFMRQNNLHWDPKQKAVVGSSGKVYPGGIVTQ